VVENRRHLDKYLECRHNLPNVRAIVVYNDFKPPGVDGVFTWQVIFLGHRVTCYAPTLALPLFCRRSSWLLAMLVATTV